MPLNRSNRFCIRRSIGTSKRNDESQHNVSFNSSQIYKTTCKGYKERIFEDLGTLTTEHCQQLKRHFDESVRNFVSLFNDDSSGFSQQNKWSDGRGDHAAMDSYLTEFIQSLDQYHRAVDIISPLFV